MPISHPDPVQPLVVAYLRGKTTQDLEGQRQEIETWAKRSQRTVDLWVETYASSTESEDRVHDLVSELPEGSTLVFTTFSRLSDNPRARMNLLNFIYELNIEAVMLKRSK